MRVTKRCRGGTKRLLSMTAMAWLVGVGSLGAASAVAARTPDDRGSPVHAPASVAMTVGHERAHDRSAPLRVLAAGRPRAGAAHGAPSTRTPASSTMPAPILNFEGIAAAHSGCICAPPDASGEPGATQYVQAVNQAYEVYDKKTGTSTLGPLALTTIWSGFGGVCETGYLVEPVVLYDQLAKRWVIAVQAAATTMFTDECIAVSTTTDATGSFHRYDFALGPNEYDRSRLAVWRDGYYMSTIAYQTTGMQNALGPQPFAFDRAAMLSGGAATFVSTAAPLGLDTDVMLPADIDGLSRPPAGAPESFVEYPSAPQYTYDTFHFHVDFANPGSSTWTEFAAPPTAPFAPPCGGSPNCVPQANTTEKLDGFADRMLFRLAYRNFGDHESVVGTYSVSTGNPVVAGVRWFELRDVTNGPESKYQESTFSPDSTWRWMGSAAMDASGDIGVGYSASSTSIAPEIRYTGRLAGDALDTLPQGEQTLEAGTGSQTSPDRWGDHTDLTVDPVDDCTFWYTNEYFTRDVGYDWHTRIGSFRFPSCTPVTISTEADAPITAYGSRIGFTVTVVDDGAKKVSGVAVSDPLPSGGGVHWSIDAKHTTGGWSITGSPPNQKLVHAASTLKGGATQQAHVIATTHKGACGQTFTNTASFTVAGGGAGQASAQEVVAALFETFDKTDVPALPAGWTATSVGGAANWATASAPVAFSAPNDAFVDDPPTVSDAALVSPAVKLSGATRLTFVSAFDLQQGHDGGVLEISVDGGGFTDIGAAGGTFVTGGYNGPISGMGSPLNGRGAWTGASPGFIATNVDLPAADVGHTIQLRWRMATDATISGIGWQVDNVSLNNGACP